MSVTKTFTVTVANPGAGNRYYIDGNLQETLHLVEGETYRFDQSASSNSGHPLRFSTTPNGSHGGGSEYTTGVTTNGTPGSSGAYTQIVVADNAPTLYYYCTNHSGMGGQANTVPPQTLTVTVVSTGGGNKYFIDGTQQKTLELVEGGSFRLDQSDSSNSGHPLRFSTTSGGSHSGGSEYTTGVNTNGTPGSSGAYTQITVASDAPTLYYYCTNHSGMGGQANTPNEDFWGAGNWSANLWGISEAFTTGWGAKAWNDGEWNQLSDETVTLSGQSITSSVGDVAAFPLQGWGSDSWGDEGWGESSLTVELTAPDAITSSVSVGSGFGDGSYGQEQGWGQFVLNPADVMGLTGVSSTSGVGSVSFTISAEFAVSGVAITSGVGAIDPTAEIVGPTGQQITSSVGSIAPADAIGLTGVSATLSVGSVDIASNPVVNVTGQAMTSSVGSIDPLAIVMGLTGVSATASVGSPLVADFAIGLTGVSATSSVAGFGTATGFGIQAYSDVDTGSNTSYTDVA
jgi:hypothetical protein